ncbi:MAG: lipopolysaccharide biosynthesis protein, partial [Gaiellaceae bacterium]
MLHRLKELVRHSAVYGLGSIVARVLAVLLLPLYTRYLSPSDYGLIETLVALSAVLTALVAQAMKSAFFRFYFDSVDVERRLLVVRTAFWYVMAASTAVLIAGVALAQPISWLLFHTRSHDGLVIAAFVGLWAAMNYEQMTSLFRVEQRSGAYVVATLANVSITIGATVLLVVAFDQGPIGVLVGNFTGTLAVYAALLLYSGRALGLQFDRKLYRAMNRFGLPLVPSALALWLTNFSDRFFLIKLADAHEV